MKVTADIVAGLVGSVLSKGYDEATESPAFHHELWSYACMDHRCVAVAAPRGHAKSTSGTIAYSLANVLFRARRYVVIVSDTVGQSEEFVGQIRTELQTNDNLIELFGIKKNEKGEVNFIKDTNDDIIVEFVDGYKFRVRAKGAGQPLRGMLWDGMRPDLIVVDDLENDELVINNERRVKLSRWFNSALMPLLSPKGAIRMWGTVLHMDSLLNNLMPEALVRNHKMIKDDGIKMWVEWPDGKIRGQWFGVKYRAHNDDMSQILWPSRFSKDYWKVLRQQHSDAGILDLYSQEYLNNPIDESVAYFKRSDLIAMTDEDKERVKKDNLRYYCTVDLAISEEARADWSVFLIAGVDENKTIHVINILRERMDGREIVDTILGLQKIYDFEAIGIEEMMISKSIGPFLREEMVNRGIFPSIVLLKHKGKDKIQRARSIQARMRAKTVKFDKTGDWYPALEDEVTKFPRGKHDDQVDTLAYLGLLLDVVVEAPTEEELDEEEYLDELRESGYESGRSAICGY